MSPSRKKSYRDATLIGGFESEDDDRGDFCSYHKLKRRQYGERSIFSSIVNFCRGPFRDPHLHAHRYLSIVKSP